MIVSVPRCWRNRLANSVPDWWPVSARAGLSAAFLIGWWLLAWTWLPSVIEAGYRNASIAPVNALFEFYGGRAAHALEEYLGYWRNVCWLGTVWCVACWFVAPVWRRMSAPSFFDRFVGAATPATLGAIRSWTCGILLMMTLWEDLASSALLPREMVRPRGVIGLLHALPIGFDAFLADASALWLFEHITALLLLLGAVGLGTRFVVPVGAACYLVLGGILRGYSWFYHTGLIPVYVLTVLSFTACDRAWSLDRLWRIARGKTVPPVDRPTAACGWARYAVWLVIAVPYVAAGCSKLYFSGPIWVASENMRAILAKTALDMMEFDFELTIALLAAPDFVFLMLGIMGLGTELTFGLVLFYRWARFALPALMVLVHVGILFLQNILFLDLILLLLVFYDWRPLRLALARRAAALRGRVEVAQQTPPAAPAAARTHRRCSAAVLGMVVVLASWWSTHYEFYPLTGMRMFSGYRSSGEIHYVKAIVHYEDGTSERAPFERWIGATADSRYRLAIEDAFGNAERQERCRRFLDAMMRAANRKEDAKRPASVEIQRWRWNVVDDPDDPDRGILTDRFVHFADRTRMESLR